MSRHIALYPIINKAVESLQHEMTNCGLGQIIWDLENYIWDSFVYNADALEIYLVDILEVIEYAHKNDLITTDQYELARVKVILKV